MITYEQWNKAIISYFFEEHDDPDQIVFLQTDAVTLLEIAKNSNFNVKNATEAINSLAKAVQDKIVCSGSVILSTVNPTKIAKEPPQVAFLALTVFAASRMSSEGFTSPRDYYIRLNEVLLEESVQNAPQGFDRRYFEKLWKHLQKWARYEHNLELYLTRGPQNGWCVWYPKSQCLITKNEQRAIYVFFRRNKLTPFSDLSDDQLESRLRYWASSPPSHKKIERYLSNEIYKKSILRQVKSLLRNWDDQIPPKLPSYVKQTTIPIDVELRFNESDNAEIRYWFPRRGSKEITYKANPLRVKRLRLLPSSEKWFRPEIDNSSTFWNWSSSDQLQLQTDEANPIVYTLGISSIWVFREDIERDDGWLSQKHMHLHEDHLILFRKHLTEQVRDCLRQTCEQDIEAPNSIHVDSKKSDWFYLQVKPTKCLSFDKQVVWKLSVVYSKQIRFIGGLAVKDLNGRRVYLDISLPSVSVPDLGDSENLPLQINDQSYSVGEDRLVRLENKLGVGIHQVSYEKKTSELRIIALDRSLRYQEKTLTTTLSEDQKTIPTYSTETTAEIAEKSGVWLAGTKLFGMDIPEVTWDDVKTKPSTREKGVNQSFKSPAQLISSIVKLAIELKFDKTSVPEWFNETIKYIDQNVAMRTLVEKKLQHYHEMALSYTDLRKRGGE